MGLYRGGGGGSRSGGGEMRWGRSDNDPSFDFAVPSSGRGDLRYVKLRFRRCLAVNGGCDVSTS